MKDANVLLKAWREKYPGAYDQVDDAKLLGAIKQKYPGAYDDYAFSGNAPQNSTMPSLGKAETITAPQGLLEHARMWYQGNVPAEVQSFITNLTKLGQIAGVSGESPTVGVTAPTKILGMAREEIMGARSGMSYKEAKDVIKTLPIKRIELTENVAESRGLLQERKASELEAANQSVEQQAQAATAPLEQEQRQLQLARRRTQEALSKEQADQAVRNRLNMQELRGQKAQAETVLQEQTAKQAQGYVEATGKPPDQIRLAGEAQAARKAEVETVQKQIRQTHKDILKIADRPANVTTKVEQRPTGVLGPDGKPVIETVTKKVPGEIDATGVKAELADEFESLQGEIQVAINNGSPGARALMQVATGPDSYSLKQALDIKAALNEIGYGKADAALSTRSEAIARQVAHKLREAIRGQVSKFKEGGDEAIKLMDNEASLLQGRDARFGTPAARSTAKSMERYGDATRLKDPVSVKAWMDEVDDATRAGAKSQVAHDLLADGPQVFAKRWKGMDPEVKALWFTPDEIKRGDEIANASTEGLKIIAKKYQQAEADRITKAVENSAVIRRRRAELGQLQTNIEELSAKEKTATEEAARNLHAQKLLANEKYRKGISELRKEVSEIRKKFVLQQQQAQKKIDRVQKFKRIGWIALAAAVGSQASNMYRGFHSALVGEP